jgi:hypothetical protein
MYIHSIIIRYKNEVLFLWLWVHFIIFEMIQDIKYIIWLVPIWCHASSVSAIFHNERGVRVIVFNCHFEQFFSYIVAVSVIGGENQNTHATRLIVNTKKTKSTSSFSLKCLYLVRKVGGHVLVLRVSILLLSTILLLDCRPAPTVYSVLVFRFMVFNATFTIFKNIY